MSGDWASWAFAWALIPAFVGLGLLLAFLGKRTLRIVGLSLMGWSMVVFVTFGMFFASHGAWIRYWPVSLILVGLMLLLQGQLVRRREKPGAD
jgi:hypothetical protein